MLAVLQSDLLPRHRELGEQMAPRLPGFLPHLVEPLAGSPPAPAACSLHPTQACSFPSAARRVCRLVCAVCAACATCATDVNETAARSEWVPAQVARGGARSAVAAHRMQTPSSRSGAGAGPAVPHAFRIRAASSRDTLLGASTGQPGTPRPRPKKIRPARQTGRATRQCDSRRDGSGAVLLGRNHRHASGDTEGGSEFRPEPEIRTRRAEVEPPEPRRPTRGAVRHGGGCHSKANRRGRHRFLGQAGGCVPPVPPVPVIFGEIAAPSSIAPVEVRGGCRHRWGQTSGSTIAAHGVLRAVESRTSRYVAAQLQGGSYPPGQFT